MEVKGVKGVVSILAVPLTLIKKAGFLLIASV